MNTTRRRLAAGAPLRVFVAAAVALAAARGARAQTTPNVSTTSTAPPPGWTLTPTFVFSSGYDDNVLLHEQNDVPTSDVLNVLNPSASLDYRGRRSDFSAGYDGALLLYRDFGTLDSYDQHGSVRAMRKLSPHVSLFAANSVASSPTTEPLLLEGVPFVRTGSRLDSLTAGVDAALTRRTSIVGGASFQWVQFDVTHPVDLVLRGGHSQGGSLSMRHTLTSRLTLTADYDAHRANVANGEAEFDVQNTSAGIDRVWSENVHAFAAAGISHLNVSTLAPGRSGLNLRAGVTARLQRAGVNITYSRAFVPSFGFGGTNQNEDLTGQVQYRLSRRTYAQSTISFRRNDPLVLGDPSLHSRWIQGIVGYTLQPWARVEGFFSTMSQSIDRPGGLAGRTQLGVQIITTTPMRIR